MDLWSVLLFYVFLCFFLSTVGYFISKFFDSEEKNNITDLITGFLLGALVSLILWIRVGGNMVYEPKNERVINNI